MDLILMYSKKHIHSPSAGQSGCKLLSFNPILREFYHAKAEWDGFTAEEHQASHDCLYQKTVPISTSSTVKPWGWELYFQKVTRSTFPIWWPAFSRKCLYVEI